MALDDHRRPTEESVGPAREPTETIRRWQPDRSSLLAYIVIGLAIASFWFDGHTVTRGFRPLQALANGVHVVAGSVRVGGVIAMVAGAHNHFRLMPALERNPDDVAVHDSVRVPTLAPTCGYVCESSTSAYTATYWSTIRETSNRSTATTRIMSRSRRSTTCTASIASSTVCTR